MKRFFKENWLVIVTGIVVGAAALLLQALGNPKNMGFCIACFERDIVGAVGLHSAEVVQYVRPEIIGIVLGSCIMALIGKEFRAQAGSAPATRFAVGALVMIGALVFLGCPLRMLLRMGGGDLNAFVGLLGFIIGALVGTIFLKKGFNLGRAYQAKKTEGFVLPVIMLVLFALALLVPSLFHASEKGPGSMHAPVLVAFAAALVVGALAQRSRLCMAGGVRDTLMLKDPHLLWGSVAIFVVVLAGGRRLASDCEAKLEAAGFKKSTYKKSKKKAGVRSVKDGFLWYWTLPEVEKPIENGQEVTDEDDLPI